MTKMNDQDDGWVADEVSILDSLRAARLHENTPAISGYSGLREIGRGGQGVVYSALCDRDGASVAIKILHRPCVDGADQRLRFQREIELASALNHPAIAAPMETGFTEDARPYLVMARVRGVRLGERLGQLDPRASAQRQKIVQIFAKISAAIAHAHQHAVIHRDLKPSNLMISEHDEPVILDLGLARSVCAQSPGASVSGQILGSLPWLSPEQAAGSVDTDVRTDIYSLGVMLYHALTGSYPYRVTGPVREVLTAIAEAVPPRPRSHNPAIEKDLEAIVLCCLSKDRSRRYLSAAELARDLERFLKAEPIEARRDSSLYTLSSLIRRHQVVSALVAVIILLTGTSAVWTGVLYRRASSAEKLASTRSQQLSFINRYLLTTYSQLLPGATVGEMTAAIDSAVAEVDVVFPDQPAMQAKLHDSFSDWLRYLNRPEAAEQQRLQSLRLRLELHGKRDPSLMKDYLSLTQIAYSMGEYERALAYVRKWNDLDVSVGSMAPMALGRRIWFAAALLDLDRPIDALEIATTMIEAAKAIDWPELERGAPDLEYLKGIHALAGVATGEDTGGAFLIAYNSLVKERSADCSGAINLRRLAEVVYSRLSLESPLGGKV